VHQHVSGEYAARKMERVRKRDEFFLDEEKVGKGAASRATFRACPLVHVNSYVSNTEKYNTRDLSASSSSILPQMCDRSQSRRST
jgi:hypothetical protein